MPVTRWMCLRVVAAACAVLGFAATVATPRAGTAAAVNLLPLSPAGQVSVLTANLNELLSGADIAETGDLDHLAYRVQAVLSGLDSRAPAVPNYAPDLVLLQESTKQSAQNAANVLSSRLGYSYLVGATSNSGTGAWTVNSDGSLRTPTETAQGEIHSTRRPASPTTAPVPGSACARQSR